ncbi:cupin-like domain-containing protein [Roseibium sp. FZY0029]|uniref:cupin-like domain-containing protein n=1 Tax=Roseibium sp. FZY0029 TaxID=3116647 RepID=UPI002ECC5B3A|nr:cupin-like domain-containing protein [Roseibium sp. FZY0029]
MIGDADQSIPTVTEAPEYAEFLARYCDKEQPLLIKGLAKSWPARGKWVSKRLRAELHTLASVRDRGVFFVSRSPVLEQDIEMPDFLREVLSSDRIMKDSVAWRFWVNSRNNRTEFHYDTNAENVITVQVKGRKEWVLVSPETPLPCYPFTNFSLLKDEEKLLKNKRFYKFDLEEGDLLYLPPLWFHRVVAKEDENININWTFTKRETSVITKEFRRDMERCGLLHFFKTNNSALVRRFYETAIRALPNVGGIGWGLKSFVSSPYQPNRGALVSRFFKELLQIPNTLLTLRNVRSTLKKVDKT